MSGSAPPSLKQGSGCAAPEAAPLREEYPPRWRSFSCPTPAKRGKDISFLRAAWGAVSSPSQGQGA
ncbi:hypothetical protein B0H12DRAFT_1116496 [Mycena haematopus]|nr:hypothetical protein B0H12DRAFT_1116496 [Mycena haematopus]